MIKTLVVEDDEDIGNLIAKQLEDIGCQVQQAENGAVALQRISEQIPDVIFLDISMPVMGGFDFLLRLRENPETSQIPVVMITATDIYDAIKRAEALGVINILAKPWEPHRLDMMLGQALMPIGRTPDIPAPGA